MTHEQTLAELTKKIVEAVSELKEPCGCCFRSPGLEDVLRALPDTVSIRNDGHMWCAIDCSEEGCVDTHEDNCEWTLGKPLSEQSPETIQFLSSLLHGE